MLRAPRNLFSHTAALALVLGACASGPAPPAAAPRARPAATSADEGPPSEATAPPTRIEQRSPPLTVPDGTTAYTIDQAIDDVAGTFAGKAVITFTNPTDAPLATLPLLLHPNASAELGAKAGAAGALALQEVTIAGAPKAKLTVRRPTWVDVALAPPLAPRAKVTLTVRYAGTLRKLGDDANDMMGQAMASMASMAGGNHGADYGLLAVGDGILTAASAYPMVAPFREGAFDTSPPPRFGDLAYNAPATFRVRTVVPAGLRVVTNLVDGVPTAQDGKEIVVSEGDMVRDLVLVAARDLDHVSAKVGRTRVTSHYRARDVAGGQTVLDVGTSALASLERRFGPYPWPELDLVEASIVGGAGGVEFCGMALIAGMFYRPPDLAGSPLGALLGGGGLDALLGGASGSPKSAGKSGPPRDPMALMQEEQLELIVAHEVAHQYFAGIVGNDSRRFPALDEPLAQYAASLVIEDCRGAAAGRAALEKHAKLSYALYRAVGGKDRDAARPSADFASPMEYAGLVYGKAPYAYVALRQLLGDATLDAALRGAVARGRFELVTLDGSIDAVEAGVGERRAAVRSIFRRYLREAHGDEDLRVDDSGEFVVRAMFPGDTGKEAAEALKLMGLTPKDVLRMVFGAGAAGKGAAGGGSPGAFDPAEALKLLDRMKH